MSERCRICRFWQLDLAPNEKDKGEEWDAGFGWCRRDPPRINEHMARMVIDHPRFGGKNYDPEDVASASHVHDATLFPATFGTNWCGRFERPHAEIAPC